MIRAIVNKPMISLFLMEKWISLFIILVWLNKIKRETLQIYSESAGNRKNFIRSGERRALDIKH